MNGKLRFEEDDNAAVEAVHGTGTAVEKSAKLVQRTSRNHEKKKQISNYQIII